MSHWDSPNDSLLTPRLDSRVLGNHLVQLVDVAQQQITGFALVVHDVTHLHGFFHLKRNRYDAGMHLA